MKPDKLSIFRVFCLLLLTTGCTEDPSNANEIDDELARTFQTWQHYLGDPGRSHYSLLDHIDTGNVDQLKVAWSYRSGGLLPGRNTQIQTNPLIVDSILFGVNAALELFALNAGTGEELWTFAPDNKDGSGLGVNRGLSYSDSRSDSGSRLFFSSGAYLYAVDIKSGKIIPEFGKNGRVDLREGLGRDAGTLSVVANTPGAVYEDLLIMGTRVAESPGAAPGHIRAYDVRTGTIRWTFHTIPQPGEEGYNTWPRDAYKKAGGANNWAGMALDPSSGMVFIPTGSAAFDFYGGDRQGSNLFANCLIALHAGTGNRIWHYQFVHHDIWDRDLPAPPNLVTVTRGGQRIPAVAQVTKSGHVFVFDRKTGEPLFPIEERSFPASSLEGEQAWPTQPIPVKPLPFARQVLTEEMLYTPESTAFIADFIDTLINDDPITVRERFRQITSSGQFIPPDTIGVIVFPGFDGGAEWGGAAIDPVKGHMFVNANEMPWIIRMKSLANEGPFGGQALYEINCARCHGGERQGLGEIPALTDVGTRLSTDMITHIVKAGQGAMPPNPQLSQEEVKSIVDFLADNEVEDHRVVSSNEIRYSVAGFGRFLDERGLPIVKPPWGTLNALDLNTGDYLWKVPLGNVDDMKDPEHPVTGTENYGGPIVTAGGLIFISATKDEKIRAFHSRTGEQLWEATLPAGGYATPATYEVNGRQYIVIACGGGKMGTKSGDVYVAFALPQ